MTREEARKESRESEGDPMLRGQIRAKQREISRRRMLAAVPSADIIVVNPTHYAVAIRYDETAMDAPRVVAKGVDILAARIQAIARESNVPVLEAPPLARALYANVEVDQEVPRALYAAIAQVLAYVYQLKRWVPGRTAAPRAPADIEVPAGMDPKAAEAA
jgi:flagellar biosynthetic protein FlhB